MFNRLNEAIAKLRHEASAPITIKMNEEKEKLIDGEKKLRDQKLQTQSVEEKAMQRRKDEYAAIKAMNKEIGNPSYEIRYGSPRSIEQGQKFNEQLEESTKRINRLADAHKHIRDVSKAADVKVSPSLAEKLATQTVNKTEKGEIEDTRLTRVEEENRMRGIAYSMKLKENNAAIEARAGAEAQIKIEKEETAALVAKIKLKKDEEELNMRQIAYSMKLKENNAAIEASAGGKAQVEIEREQAVALAAKIKLKKEEEELNTRQIAYSMKLKENNAAIEAAAGGKAQVDIEREAMRSQLEAEKEIIAAEKERIRLVRERNAQEEEGAKRVAAMDREAERQEQAVLRKQKEEARELERAQNKARRERENELASSRTTGLRGVAGELVRDTRRNMTYGAISRGEELVHSGFDAGIDRSKEIEAQYQSGRTPQERREIEKRAEGYSDKYAMISKTEGMTLQRHAIGEVGNVKEGMGLADLASPFVALRTAAVGAEAALTENQKIMKGFNELGWVKSPDKMKVAYENIAKMSQVEGQNFDVGSWLTIIRMAKSAKFAMSDEAMMRLAPLISIGEAAGRTGNEFNMLFKTLAMEGKALDNSVGKSNRLKYIEGTDLSNGKGGFNPELAKDVASGTSEGIRKFNNILDKAAASKGVDTKDPLAFSQWLTHVFANQSSKELAMWFHEKADFVDKQLGMYDQARGTAANVGIEKRDIGTAIEGSKAKFSDAASAMMEPFKSAILGAINTTTALLKYAAKNPGTATGAVATVGAGIGALAMKAAENPSETALTIALAANTGATITNTGALAASDIKGLLGGIGGSIGLLSKLGIGAGVVAGIYDVKLAFDDLDQYMKNRKLKEAAKTPEGIKKYNDDVQAQDKADLDRAKHAQDQVSTLPDKDNPKLKAFIDGKIKEAQDKINQDKAHPFVYKKGVVNDDGVNPDYGKRRSEGSTPTDSKPIWHTQAGKSDVSWKSGIDMSSTSTSKLDKGAADSAIAKISEEGNKTAAAMSGAGSSIASAGSTIEAGAGSAAGSISSGGAQISAALSAVAAQIAAVKIQGPAAASSATTPTNLGHSGIGHR